MDYGALIGDAFRISWRNKYLWFFGLFVGSGLSFPGGGGGGGGETGNDFQQSLFSGTPELALAEGAVAQFGEPNWALITALAVVGLALLLLYIFLLVVSNGGLTASVAAIDGGEERRFGLTWREGLFSFWRVVGYYVIFILLSLAVLAVVGLPSGGLIAATLLATESIGARVGVIAVVGLLAVIALIVLYVALAIVAQFALRLLVLERAGIAGCFGGGLAMLRANKGRSVLVWLVQLAVMIGAGIAFLLALAVVGIVVFLPAILLGVAGANTAAVIAGIIGGIIILPLFLAGSGALGAFNHAYWTLAYLRLQPPATQEGSV